MTGSRTNANEEALLLVSRKLREGYALALHGLEVDVDDAGRVVHLRPRPPIPVSTERTEAARAAVQRSDVAALNACEKTHREIETMELRSAVRALIQEVEMLRAELGR